jgi:hypothetical protein
MKHIHIKSQIPIILLNLLDIEKILLQFMYMKSSSLI